MTRDKTKTNKTKQKDKTRGKLTLWSHLSGPKKTFNGGQQEPMPQKIWSREK